MNKDFEAGQKAMAKDIIFYIRKNLGPDLKVNTNLNTKEAYNFATTYAELLKAEFLSND
jgi:hypothetical protein